MGKNKKANENRSKRKDTPKGISFVIEDNALDLMLEYLDMVKPQAKDSDSSAGSRGERRRKVQRRECTIDLHGLTLDEAEAFLEEKMAIWLASAAFLRVKVITGKGRHSKDGEGVLAREIHRFMKRRFASFIVEIEESPDDLRISGVPIRGHFHVTLKGQV